MIDLYVLDSVGQLVWTSTMRCWLVQFGWRRGRSSIVFQVNLSPPLVACLVAPRQLSSDCHVSIFGCNVDIPKDFTWSSPKANPRCYPKGDSTNPSPHFQGLPLYPSTRPGWFFSKERRKGFEGAHADEKPTWVQRPNKVLQVLSWLRSRHWRVLRSEILYPRAHSQRAPRVISPYAIRGLPSPSWPHQKADKHDYR